MIKRLKSKKGMTLIELIAAMMVFAVISTCAAALMGPILNIYARANDLAEVSNLLDTLSAEILNDLADASDVIIDPADDTTVTIQTNRSTIVYSVDTGILYKETNNREAKPVLGDKYSGNMTVGLFVGVDATSGVCTVTINIIDGRDGSIMASRPYSIRPLGLT